MGLDGVGAWPPVKESHVEMDAAWALYEAWVAIQTGDVDSAIIYGFGKASLGDLHEVWTLQTDPYTVATLWPSMVDMAALQADALPRRRRARTERDLAEVAARSLRDAQGNPHAVDRRRRERRRPARPSGDAPAAARQRRRADHRRRRRDRDRGRPDVATRALCERPAWIRGIEHRIDPQHLGAARPRDRAVGRTARPRRRACTTGRSTSPRSTPSSATRS